MKKIVLLILFIFIQFSFYGIYGADKESKLTGGFSTIKYKGKGKNNKWVKLFNDKKMAELYNDFLKDVTNGVPFNFKLKESITDTLKAGINHELENLKSCMGGDYSKKIEDKKKSGKIELRFDDSLRIHDGYNDVEQYTGIENVTLSAGHLEKIIHDITYRIKKNEKWYPDNIYTIPWYKDFLTDIGHEMIHTHAGIAGGHRGECIAHCLTKKCINSKHDPRDFQYSVVGSFITNPLQCDRLKFPPEIKEKMGEGKCFCDVNWENPYDNEPCEEEEPEPEPPASDGSSNSSPSRPNETPDDNFSHSSGIYALNNLLLSNIFPINIDQEFFNCSYYPDILIYNKFNYPDLPQLLEQYQGFSYINDYVHDHFSNQHKILIIPSGELMGDENSEIIKAALEQFVASGGTLLVLSQQYDTHYENLMPLPENETLKAYGWRQDQSCYNGSVYFEGIHPIVSSSTNQLLTAAVDGYFSQWPANATVILNRTKNKEAALLYYPYGENGGHVIFASLYTDWGHSHSQATLAEINAVRDLITFAKNPALPIPMYNLENNPTPEILLNIKVKNNSDTLTSKVKLIAYTPDRQTVLFETEQAVGLNPGEEAEIPITFSLPPLESKDYGICHVDFHLFDAENNLVQLPTESDGGRFAVYNIEEQYTPGGGIDAWLTVEDERIFLYETAKFTLHVKNHTEIDQTVAFEYECNHRGKHPLFTLTIPAGQEIEKAISFEHEEPFVRFWIYYYDTSNTLREISKGLTLIRASTSSSLTLHSPTLLEPGGSLEYTVVSNHLSPNPPAGDYPVRVALEGFGYQFHKNYFVFVSEAC